MVEGVLTGGQRRALQAVRAGEVLVDGQGCRDYPTDVRAASLDAAHTYGYWRWPNTPPLIGDVAQLTERGQCALDVAERF